MPFVSEILESRTNQSRSSSKRSRKNRSSSKNNNSTKNRNKECHEDKIVHEKLQEVEKQKECGHIVEASFVIQNEKKEATRSVANNFEVSQISDKDRIEIPSLSSGLSEQEKQRKTEVILNKNIDDLKLESYSKSDLIKIIEFSLLSYVEGLNENKSIHVKNVTDTSRLKASKTTDDFIKLGHKSVCTVSENTSKENSQYGTQFTKKELKKQRQREQRQQKEDKPSLEYSMANSQRGWDRLVNPVQDLGRTLLNFLVGGNSANNPSQTNPQGTDNLDDLNKQYPFPPTPKSDKSSNRQRDGSNANRKQSTPIVLRRSQPHNQSTAASFTDERSQKSQLSSNTTPLGQSVPEKRDSDLVAFAIQDNSAAVHSPPVLVPPNVSKRKKRKENVEVKAAIGKVNKATRPSNIINTNGNNDPNETQSKIISESQIKDSILDSTVSNEILNDATSKSKEIPNSIEDVPTSPRISFNNIVERLSRSDLDDVKIEVISDKSKNLEVVNKESEELVDTPKPSFRKIQERLKQTTELAGNKSNQDIEGAAISSVAHNDSVEQVPLSDKNDSLPSLEVICSNENHKLESVFHNKDEDKVSDDVKYEIADGSNNISLHANTNFISQPIKLEPNDFKVSSLTYPFDHGESNQNRLQTEGEEKVFIQEIMTNKTENMEVNERKDITKEDDSSINENSDFNVELGHRSTFQNIISEDFAPPSSSLNENGDKDEFQKSSDSDETNCNGSKLVPENETLLNADETKSHCNSLSDNNVDSHFDHQMENKVQMQEAIESETSICEDNILNLEDENVVDTSAKIQLKSISDINDSPMESNDPENVDEQMNTESLTETELLVHEKPIKVEQANQKEQQIDEDTSTKANFVIPPPPPPPPPGFLIPISNKNKEVNDAEGGKANRMETTEKAKVNPAEVALLKQLESLQDPIFANFLKSNLYSTKSISRDKTHGNASEDKCETSQARRHRKSRRISENEATTHVNELKLLDETQSSCQATRQGEKHTQNGSDECWNATKESKVTLNEREENKHSIENESIRNNSTNSSPKECHHQGVDALRDSDQNKSEEYITDNTGTERQEENLTNLVNNNSSAARKVRNVDNPCEENIATNEEITNSNKKHAYEEVQTTSSHDRNIKTNEFNSLSYKTEEKEGVNENCNTNSDSSSILHASTDSTSSSGEHSDVMSQSKQQITEIIDKPIIATTGGGQQDRVDKKPQCNKPLSKSDSGFSEHNIVSTMNGKETCDVTSKVVSVDDEVPSEECEDDEEFDSCEDGEEVAKRKELNADQAHKLFDKRYGAQLALSFVSNDLKNEFEEAGATSPLERSIKKLRRGNSVNVKDNKKVSKLQHVNSKDISDDDYEDYSEDCSDEDDDMSQDGVRLRSTRGGSADPRTFSSRRSSTDSSEDGFNLNVRDLKNELKELEEKFRKAMVANAGLDNEKSALNYQVELLKDQMEEVEEQASLVTKELREKNRDYELLKRSHAETQRAVQLLQAQLDEQARLLAERGMVLVGNEDEDTTCEDEDRANANGALNYEEQEKRTRAIVSSETASILGALGLKGQPLDVRIRKLADERDDLGDTVRRLKMDLEEERQRNSRLEKMAPHQMSAEEAEWETKKAMDDYKFKLQKAEQDINTLQTNVARLESQVIRFKTAAETAERSEEELKTERRKMQRELREATTRVEELETANKHLETRLGKLKTAKSTLLKEL